MTKKRVAINGYGRIGRNILRALYASKQARNRIEIVAINCLTLSEGMVHLTKYDSVFGTFPLDTAHDQQSDTMSIDGDSIQLLHEKDPRKLPWKDLNIDVVLECTGLFVSKESAMAHIDAGAKKVIVSAPATDADATIVYGVNHDILDGSEQIISNSSCTTNCVAPIAKVLLDNFGIDRGTMITVHAYTNDQNLTDATHTDLYRARSATQSMIPTTTGATKAVGLVIPELAGKLTGRAVRVPCINVSLIDMVYLLKKEVSVEQVHQCIKEAADNQLRGVLAYNDKPLVSIDFKQNPHSVIFDTNKTTVSGNMLHLMAWYDNEWGFSNRMLDLAYVISR